MMSDPIYDTLSVARQEFRLLHVAPGLVEDELQATLSTASLKSIPFPDFEALSYVWGDPSIRRPIIVNNTEILVTENVHAALRRIRQPEKCSALWVDALCVNQADSAERSSQVLFMRQIYSQASKVLIWLGEEERDDKEGLDFLAAIAKGEHLFTQKCPPQMASSQSIDSSPKCPNKFEALNSILRKDWWTRTWTLQEICLAKNAVILCGSLTMPWVELDGTQTETWKHLRTCCRLEGLCKNCKATCFLANTLMVSVSSQRRKMRHSRAPGLLELLMKNRFRQATDPRDKIYAMLSLVPDIYTEKLAPDYDSKVETLYLRAVLLEVSNHRHLDVFSFVGDKHPSSKLPSWVPDWRLCSNEDTRGRTSKRLSIQQSHRACGSFVNTRGTFRDDGLLELEGVFVDTVQTCGSVFDDNSLRSDRIVRTILTQWAAITATDPSSEEPYPRGNGTIKEAFWRTMTLGVVQTHFAGERKTPEGIYRPANEQNEAAFWRWWCAMDSQQDLAINDSECHFVALNTPAVLYMRRLFVTTSGEVGLGPATLEEGDQVWVLAGGKAPYALRTNELETLNGNPALGEGTLSLVGDLYVHGVMDGEAMEDFERDKKTITLA